MDKCPSCGAKVYSSDKRCSKCGQELKKDSSKSVIAILLVIVAIAVVGVLASGVNTSDTTDMSVASYDDSVQESTSSADSVKETTSTDQSQKETSTVQEDTSSSGAVYWASEESDKFHKPSCEWAQKISDYNKIVYHSRQEAINDGRVPCHVCYP